MYYRYKTKKKSRPVLKLSVTLVVIAALVYTGYLNRQYILFWKYTTNKIVDQISAVEAIKDPLKRRNKLNGLLDVVDQYKIENPVDSEAFLMGARVYYHLAQTFNPGTFSEMLVNNKLKVKNKKAYENYISAIRHYKKGIMLQRYGDIAKENTIDYGRALYMTNYSSIKEIMKAMTSLGKANLLKDIEDKRFYGVLQVLNGQKEEGLTFLKNHGSLSDSIYGTLFLAVTEKIAKNYTSSIMHFKKIILTSKDNALLKLVYMNLGEIYFSQTLYKESLGQFVNAQKIDEGDLKLKLWISKNYNALGEKDKARALISEVLAKDNKNNEARHLLRIM